ncbi:hypothetical protein K502DRAFT_351085 [Neoconidiobolus thromboides FSU 785]|nr:hypothetical protein K502DRAFT_351085 [Neoconidiobolus thromboides FSU 785]
MKKWFDFPKLDFGLSPEASISLPSYSAAIIVSGIGIGLGLLLHKYSNPGEIKEKEKEKEIK